MAGCSDNRRAAADQSRTAKTLIALLILLPLLLLVGANNLRNATDDAYITYRYAQNLIRGNGFVYNPGERHLGTTSPLFAIVLAVAGWIYPDVPLWGSLISLLALGAVAGFAYRLLERGASFGAGLISIPLVLLNPVLIASLGNETCLLLTFILGQYYFWRSGRRYAFAIFGALGALTRGEGILFPLILFGFDFAEQFQRKRIDLKPLAVFAIVLLPWFAFSRLYFGYFLPSTLRVKMIMTRLPNSPWIPFLPDVVSNLPGRLAPARWQQAFILVLGLTGAAGALIRRKFVPLLLFFAAYFVGYSLLRVAAFPWYHAPLALGLSFFIAYGIHLLTLSGFARPGRTQGAGEGRHLDGRLFPPPPDLIPDPPRTKPFLPVGTSLLAFSLLGYFSLLFLTRRGIAFPDDRLAPYSMAGKWLRENTPPAATVGIPEVGVIGFYADRRMLDIDGLVFPEMTRPDRMHNYQYLISAWRPDYIISQGRAPYPRYQPGDVHPGIKNRPFRYVLAEQVRSPRVQVAIWKRKP